MIKSSATVSSNCGYLRSTPRTQKPSALSRLTRWFAIKPPAPHTRAVFIRKSLPQVGVRNPPKAPSRGGRLPVRTLCDHGSAPKRIRTIGGKSAPIVNIVEPNDVVLAQIAARLDLDQLERDAARIGQPMQRPDRDIDRLVLVHGPDFLPDRDLGGAAHHHPVLGAVMMLLQRQLAARRDGDAFDLEAIAGVDGFVKAPW